MKILIERLFLYRRILGHAREDGKSDMFSHELANLAGATSEQVRRDLMLVGAEGHRRRGYNIDKLLKHFDGYLHANEPITAVLVGLGHLGRAILTYFSTTQTNIRIMAAFDNNPSRTGRVISGCESFDIATLKEHVQRLSPQIGIIAVPASAAPLVAQILVEGEVKAFLNFAPVRLRLPPHVEVENMDMTLSLQKLAFVARDCKNLS